MDFEEALQFKRDLIEHHPTAMQDIVELEDMWREDRSMQFMQMCKRLVGYGLRVVIEDNGPKVQIYQLYTDTEDTANIKEVKEDG